MRVIGYSQAGTIDRLDAFLEREVPEPTPSGRDLLVEVRAVSVNPADTEIRAGAIPVENGWKTLGFDAAGVVVSVGPEATLFRPGDEVSYAGKRSAFDRLHPTLEMKRLLPAKQTDRVGVGLVRETVLTCASSAQHLPGP